ncbi:MAG: hypothetical protein ACOYKM_09115, partial [Caulobacterales bacterium]
AEVYAGPAAKNAQQRLPEEPDIQLSVYRPIAARETGGSCPNYETSHRPLSKLETLHSLSALPPPADRHAIARSVTRGFPIELAVWRPRWALAGAELALPLVGLASQSVGSTVVARSTSGALWPLGTSRNTLIFLRKMVPLA